MEIFLNKQERNNYAQNADLTNSYTEIYNMNQPL